MKQNMEFQCPDTKIKVITFERPLSNSYNQHTLQIQLKALKSHFNELKIIFKMAYMP